MLWNLVESSEIVLFCIVFYGRPSGWYDIVSDLQISEKNRECVIGKSHTEFDFTYSLP